MDVKLIVQSGKSAGQEVRIPPPKFFVGRAEDCQMRPKSDLISRHHCVIMVENEDVILRDLGSRNGTHVNEQRVIGEQELKTGDRLTIGPLEFEVAITVDTKAKKRPRVNSIKEAATRTAETVVHESDDDVDVEEWLAADRPDEVLTRTREIAANDTEEISMGRTTVPGQSPLTDTDAGKKSEPVTPVEETPVADVSKDEKPSNRGKAQPGKLPPMKRQIGADSCEAATDTLRKLFQRR